MSSEEQKEQESVRLEAEETGNSAYYARSEISKLLSLAKADVLGVHPLGERSELIAGDYAIDPKLVALIRKIAKRLGKTWTNADGGKVKDGGYGPERVGFIFGGLREVLSDKNGKGKGWEIFGVTSEVAEKAEELYLQNPKTQNMQRYEKLVINVIDSRLATYS